MSDFSAHFRFKLIRMATL